MQTPEGVHGSKYVKLNKALYGLKQAGKAWYDKLDGKFTVLNFKKPMNDQCIYIHPRRQIVVGVYVDDLVIRGKLLGDVEEVKRRLTSYFPIKDLGEIDTVIGWKITRDRSTRSLNISQAHYIDDKIKSFGLGDAKSYSAPLDGYSGILPARLDESLADDTAHASAVGSLGYASNSTRPDISFTVSQLAGYNSSPVQRHWNSVCRVFRYLKGTNDYCIKYYFGPPSNDLSPELTTKLYSDSDYASDVTTPQSVSGYILMLGGGPIILAIEEAEISGNLDNGS
ncbi:hypothetical protein K3495_g9829 [Podosphaera aphanis]|nr:hypothetical protein K3495_g9829 [Podosphaera aphanis]